MLPFCTTWRSVQYFRYITSHQSDQHALCPNASKAAEHRGTPQRSRPSTRTILACVLECGGGPPLLDRGLLAAATWRLMALSLGRMTFALLGSTVSNTFSNGALYELLCLVNLFVIIWAFKAI